MIGMVSYQGGDGCKDPKKKDRSNSLRTYMINYQDPYMAIRSGHL